MVKVKNAEKIDTQKLYDITISGKALYNLQRIQSRLMAKSYSEAINKVAELLFLNDW